jgi:hypothetical protein
MKMNWDIDFDPEAAEQWEFSDLWEVQCLMERRLQWTGDRYGLKLNGGHRAAGDCRKALALLQKMGGWA